MFSGRLKIKFRPNAKKTIKYSIIAILLLGIGATFYTAIYLYNNFYLTITQSQDIVLSNEKVSIDTINIKKFDTVIRNIENKTNPVPYSALQNIFR